MNIKILDLRSTKADKGLSKASEVGDGECWVVFFFIVIFSKNKFSVYCCQV